MDQILLQKEATMRQSHYNEIVKIDDNRYFLFNTITCSADLVNEKVVNWLKMLRLDHSQENANGFTQEFIEKMISQGYITNSSAADEHQTIKRKFEDMRSRFMLRKHYYLVPTYACNMRCIYCFEQDLQMRDKPEQNFPVLTREMLQKFFELVISQDAKSTPERRFPIVLFGGEPLMIENYDLVEDILVKGTDLGYPFTVITNGYDLIDFIPLLKRFPGKIDLHVTLDGPPEIHDVQRPGLHGEPTFDRITAGIAAAVSEKIPVFIRSNVDERTATQLPRFIQFIQEKGWDQNPLVHFAVACIGAGDDYSCINSSRQNAERQPIQHRKLPWRQQLGRASAFEKMILLPVLQGRKPIRFPRFWFCDAHTGQQLYDPLGMIYSCTELAGKEEALIGKYWPDFEMDETRLAQWQARDVFSMKTCNHCKYSLVCGGGCACQALRTGSGITESVCWDIKGFLQEYLPIYFKEGPAAARLLLMASNSESVHP